MYNVHRLYKNKKSPRKDKHKTCVIHVVVQQLLSSELMKFLSQQDFSKCWYYNLRKPSTTAYSTYSIYYYQK